MVWSLAPPSLEDAAGGRVPGLLIARALKKANEAEDPGVNHACHGEDPANHSADAYEEVPETERLLRDSDLDGRHVILEYYLGLHVVRQGQRQLVHRVLVGEHLLA